MKTTVSIEDLVCMGVDEETAACWFLVRKDKKAKVLTTVTLRKITNQGLLLGWDLNRVINKCVEKEWKGFEASWVKDEPVGFIEKHTDKSWRDGLIKKTSDVDFVELHTNSDWAKGLN